MTWSNLGIEAFDGKTMTKSSAVTNIFKLAEEICMNSYIFSSFSTEMRMSNADALTHVNRNKIIQNLECCE